MANTVIPVTNMTGAGALAAEIVEQIALKAVLSGAGSSIVVNNPAIGLPGTTAAAGTVVISPSPTPRSAQDRRTAIGVHHTATSDSSWDGPANESRLRTDEDAAYYRKAYAWRDSDGDPETKAAYRFIHHEVSADGAVGAANLRACSSAIGVLNGGRGGTTIPDGDREGVWRHLAAHLRDGDQEPPELNALRGDGAEHRRMWRTSEVRLIDPEDGEPQDTRPRIEGYAAVFNSPSEEIEEWGFRFTEIIRPGAFAKTLKEADVRALVNHDVHYVLGRTSAGTLLLTEDKRGLAVDVEPPDTQWARDLMKSMRRGDVREMSFAFNVVKERFTEDSERRTVLRELLEVKLFDVSVVTFPSYPTTSAAVRGIWQASGLNFDQVSSALLRARAGASLSCEDGACLRGAIGVLQTHLPREPVADHSVEAAARRRQLDLMELALL